VRWVRKSRDVLHLRLMPCSVRVFPYSTARSLANSVFWFRHRSLIIACPSGLLFFPLSRTGPAQDAAVLVERVSIRPE
jgi:hypothetical protein